MITNLANNFTARESLAKMIFANRMNVNEAIEYFGPLPWRVEVAWRQLEHSAEHFDTIMEWINDPR